jgi:hypothetical protein
MFFSIVKWTIISLTLIFLVHHLYSFLMNTLTVPKIKDLVNKPKEQYNDILQTIHKGTNAKRSDHDKGTNAKRSDQDKGKDIRSDTMQSTDNTMTDELSSFLNDLKKTGGEQASISGASISGASIVSANISAANNIASASDFNSGSAFSTF